MTFISNNKFIAFNFKGLGMLNGMNRRFCDEVGKIFRYYFFHLCLA